ncbi:hypothetical protein TB2_040094 [Malus domestica]
MFVAWDRLFALHNALLVESWSMKAVFFYFIWMLVIYMLTSTKQTMQRDTGFTCFYACHSCSNLRSLDFQRWNRAADSVG